MKRKILRILIPLCMVLCFLTVTAAAYGGEKGQGKSLFVQGVNTPGSAASLAATFAKHTHCVCGGTNIGDHTSHTNVEWTLWNDANSLPTSAGSYYLVQNVTMSDAWTVKADIRLCLGGKTVTFQTGSTQIHSGSLTISDCGGNGSMMFQANGLEAVDVCTITLFGGTLKGDKSGCQ